MNDNEMDNIISDLTRYAELDGTEWGETSIALINLWNMRTYLSDEFIAQLEKEIRSITEDVKENATITEREITVTHKVVDLEWL